ncbi:endolytic transglycosylase MltG [Limnohabitans planktonicus]|uniref:Endolytic murein transglycosylase n=1 Tax=Limnohabitans planktonicus II-D5 TaxID=1293045 RepID=A0A2T7UHX1_9BURK|nr:endolytic transglycosylase MltG [Limnohabitans planktonicus]PVE44218.1 aminodeoxychorismate lyase [Limnohabitans planktonicus II-D5]|eukprot:gene3680-3597_t
MAVLKGLMKLLLSVMLLALGLAAAGVWWLNQPMDTRQATLDLSIEPGTSPKSIAQAVVDAGAQTSPTLLYAWFRVSGQSRLMRAGSYEMAPGTTPHRLLSMLVRGEESLRTVTIVEGWNWRQVRQALAKAESLKPDSRVLSDDALMAQLGRPGVAPEGRFYPDTYAYAKGSSDLAVLQRAMKAMDKHVQQAWSLRQPDASIKSPEEALILASIVEKETGKGSDRPLISGVFNNRLRIGMRLQTDPTVIYGLGEAFDGNLRRVHLSTDTPWNTYTRAGLPPTPIAMPGKSALMAAVKPAKTAAIYFVAKGDGSSHFSATLDEHNRAVNRYQRGQ